jgi:hypothetical protein
MTRLVSLGTKIEQLDGLRDTNDLTQWEQGFVTSILERYLTATKDTRWMTSKQVDVVERIWKKHFA